MDINKKSSKGIAILLALNLIGSVMCPDYAWALRRMAVAEDRELEQELIVEGIDINRSLRLLKEAGREVEKIINNSGVLVYIDKLEEWSKREKSGEADLEEGRKYLRELGQLMEDAHKLLRGLKFQYDDVKIIFLWSDSSTLKRESMFYDLYDKWGKIRWICEGSLSIVELRLQKRKYSVDDLLEYLQEHVDIIVHSSNAYIRLLEDIKFHKNIDPEYANSLDESNNEPEYTSRFLVFHKQYSRRSAAVGLESKSAGVEVIGGVSPNAIELSTSL